MSAFIVSRKHIQLLVTAAGVYGCINSGNEDEIGQLLWEENIKSVLYRYPQDTKESAPGPIGETYRYIHQPLQLPLLKSVEIIKACQCYEYQSCEHPTWERSQAKRLIDSIMAEAIGHLPGYEQAPWGVD